MTTTRDEKPKRASDQSPTVASSDAVETAPVEVPEVVALVTVEKFIRSVKNKELAGAFAHVESLQRPVRRKSQADWQKDFDAWLVQPRR